MPAIHLPAAQHATLPWKNGLGVSRIIACEPPGAGYDALLWQVGSTTFGADCPFSELPGLDRLFMVIDGAGVELSSIDDSGTLRVSEVEPNGPPYAFRGDWKTSCRMLGGPVRVLNVLARRNRVEAEVEFTQKTTARRAKDETLIAVDLGSLDAWLLPDSSDRAELPLVPGRVAVVRVRPAGLPRTPRQP